MFKIEDIAYKHIIYTIYEKLIFHLTYIVCSANCIVFNLEHKINMLIIFRYIMNSILYLVYDILHTIYHMQYIVYI